MGIFGWWLSSALALGMCVGMEVGRGCKYVGVEKGGGEKGMRCLCVCVCARANVHAHACGYVCVVNISLCREMFPSVGSVPSLLLAVAAPSGTWGMRREALVWREVDGKASLATGRKLFM